MYQTSDLHVCENRPLASPTAVRQELMLSEAMAALIVQTRQRIVRILNGSDRRLLVIVGPCSIHDERAAYEYGTKLYRLRNELSDSLEIVMRAYFEKPRTVVGWKGLIYDPHLDGSYDINTGLHTARKLLLDLTALGLPTATELLDPIVAQYLADAISWTAIGARTVESQIHRQMASGLSMPVGFKNSTDGSLDSAINGILAASHPHNFIGIDFEGRASIVETTGNPDCHLVLRGGARGPNYSAEFVESAAQALQQRDLPARVLVDCSHGNSNKDHDRQKLVVEAIAEQVVTGSSRIMGVMLESFLVAGKQKATKDLDLVYGQSITDACMDFETTETVLRSLSQAVSSQSLTAAV